MLSETLRTMDVRDLMEAFLSEDMDNIKNKEELKKSLEDKTIAPTQMKLDLSEPAASQPENQETVQEQVEEKTVQKKRVSKVKKEQQ